MVQIGTPKNIESSKKTTTAKVEEVVKASSTEAVVENVEETKSTKRRK